MLYSYPAPCVSFVPLFMRTFTDAPDESPCSASAAFVVIFTFSIASIEGTKVVYCTTHGLRALTPSMRTFAALFPCPLKENCIDFEGLFVPPWSCPLGGVTPGTNCKSP